MVSVGLIYLLNRYFIKGNDGTQAGLRATKKNQNVKLEMQNYGTATRALISLLFLDLKPFDIHLAPACPACRRQAAGRFEL
jgi:hypothetical protein